MNLPANAFPAACRLQIPSVMPFWALSGRGTEFDSHDRLPLSRKMCRAAGFTDHCRCHPLQCDLWIGLDFLTGFA